MMNWQPIESAPKDGTDVLLFDGEDMYVARWGECDSVGDMEWVYGISATYEANYYLTVDNPTHWCIPDKP